MKVLVKVALLSLVGFAFSVTDKRAIKVAISQIVKNHFAKTVSNLRIIKYSGNSTEIDGIANGIAMEEEDSLSFDIFDLNQNQLKDFELNQSAILLFNDLDALMIFYYTASFKVTSFDTIEILAYIEKNCTEGWMVGADMLSPNFVFMRSEGNDLVLRTFNFFNSGNCKIPIEVEVNRFSKSSITWRSNDFFLAKLEDFNGCKLVIAMPNETGFDLLENDLTDGSFSATGLNINVLEALAKRMNFSMIFTEANGRNERNFTLHVAGSISPRIGAKDAFFSHTYLIDPLQFMVPPGELYTPAEKLRLPFDLPTWICFIAVFVVSFLIIFLLSISRDSLKDYFFGSNVTSPTMNLFQHFFGFGQTSLPKKNFARYILMMFIL